MANSACGVGAFVVGRVPASSTAGRVPEPIVGGSAIQLSGSRQSPPIMAGARRWTAWDSMDSTGSVWLMNAICRPLTGHSGRSLRGQWMLTGRPVSRPRARGPPLSQAPGKASWHAWAALADPSSSPQSHCWTAGARGMRLKSVWFVDPALGWGVRRPLKRETDGALSVPSHGIRHPTTTTPTYPPRTPSHANKRRHDVALCLWPPAILWPLPSTSVNCRATFTSSCNSISVSVSVSSATVALCPAVPRPDIIALCMCAACS